MAVTPVDMASRAQPLRRAAPSSIRTFSLYGEEGPVADAEFIHVEDIRSRSERYEWEIDTHAHKGLFQVVFVLEGRVRVRLDERVEEGPGPRVAVIPPAVVHAFQFEPGTRGYVLTVAEARLFDRDSALGHGLMEELVLAPRLVAIDGRSGDAERVAGLLEQILAEFRWPRPGRGPMMEWLARAVLLMIARLAQAGAGVRRLDRQRGEVFSRFRQLVEAHYKEHWPVPRYAEVLRTTESRLNRICKGLTGRSAFDVIQDRLLLEARRRLTYIAAPVSLLAYELGFQDPAYFCRFFKKATGLTPSAFRSGEGGRVEPAAGPAP
ncbi:MAG: helix-turn-helix domain-containing protein [Rhodocyclaceae bacterium]|nr:helix-turn-helix domain-containing protein [Rhodocyclaceae bacterium]